MEHNINQVADKLEATLSLATHDITRLLKLHEVILRHNIILLKKFLANKGLTYQ